MNTAPRPTPETVQRLATEVVQAPLTPSQSAAVAELLSALYGDMQAMLGFDVGVVEPAPVYRAQP